jgi:hypothetical protein
VINPDIARSIKSDSITAPNVLRVELANGDVLDDNVGNATSKTQALSKKHATLASTNDGLVALDLDRVESSLVVADINARSAGLVIGAPVILVNGDLKNIKSALCLRRYVGFDPSYLASRAGAVRSTSSLGGSPLSASEVESLRQDDSVRVGRGQVALQLLSGSRSDSLSSSTAGSLGSIALRFARNRLSRNDRGGGNESRAQRSDRRHT